MSLTLQAVEMTAHVDENGLLHGDEPLQGLNGGQVRVLVLMGAQNGAMSTENELDYDDSELTSEQWNRGVARLMAKEWENEPDIYSWEDGKPFNIEDYMDEASP